MLEVLLNAKNINKSYASHKAVIDFNLQLQRGQICALLGQNGAGKSSVLRMLAGIFFPDDGQLELFTNKKIGYLPEERGLYQNMKVQEHLEYIAKLRGCDTKTFRQKASDTLDKVGLSEWKNQLVKQLSKGMQQKVQLLATILHEPDLLILDEPFSGLDPVSLLVICDLIKELKSNGSGIIISAHQMKITDEVSDQFCFLHEGKTTWQGSREALKEHFGQNTYKFTLGNNAEIKWPEELQKKIILESSLQGENNLKIYEVEFNDEMKLKEVLDFLVGNYELKAFEHYSPSLEEAFKRLTV